MKKSEWTTLIGPCPPRAHDIFFKIIEDRGLFDSEIHSLLRRSASEFSNWRHGKKPVVRTALDELQVMLKPTAEEKALWYLANNVEAVLQRLSKHCLRKLGRSQSLHDAMRRTFLKAIVDVHHKKRHYSINSEYEYFNAVIFSVEQTLKLFIDVFNGDSNFYDRSNMRWHLCHPNNLAVIACINRLNEYDEGKIIVESIICCINDACDRVKSIHERRAVENAVHLKSRLGDFDSAGHLKRIGVSDPFTERALLFAASDEESIARCEWHLQKRDDCGQALVNFEIVHLGDARTSSDGTFRGIARPPVGMIRATTNSLLSGLDKRRDKIRKYQLLEAFPLVGGHINSVLCKEAIAMIRGYIEIEVDYCDVDRRFSNYIRKILKEDSM